jgi:hypothetical protein
VEARTTALFVFALAAPLLPIFVGAGCSAERTSAEDGVEEEEDDAGAVYCLVDVAAMNGKSCTVEGQECVADFACQVTTQLVRCTCRGSRWGCKDSVGDLATGAAPRCVDPGPAAQDACPATMRVAQGSACTGIGRACFYEGERCSSGIKKLDYCSCRRKDGGLAYACRRVRCPDSYFEDEARD